MAQSHGVCLLRSARNVGTLMKLFLTFVALMGIIAGKTVSAFTQGFAHGAPTKEEGQAMKALVDQNTTLMNHLIGTNSDMMKNLVYAEEKESDESQVMSEVTCRNDHIDLIRRLVDEDAEIIIKETASWASSVLGSYELKLKNVSLEPDRPSEMHRENDVLVVFHVLGRGENALRFQGEVSRKIRDIAFRVGGQSGDLLRAEVRWSNY